MSPQSTNAMVLHVTSILGVCVGLFVFRKIHGEALPSIPPNPHLTVLPDLANHTVLLLRDLSYHPMPVV